jgi:hypothetical protein
MARQRIVAGGTHGVGCLALPGWRTRAQDGSNVMAAPARRTVLVLALLIAAMTLASTLLLLLEPGSVSGLRPITPLAAVERTGDGAHRLFATQPAMSPERWLGVRIHFSGSAVDSPATIERLHERVGLDGLAHHFVIGNGIGAPDGQIHVSPAWQRQLPGFSAALRPRDPMSLRVIDICLIGDGRQDPPTQAQLRMLVWLVHQLQARLEIPPQQVLLEAADPYAVRLFPHAAFRQQLLGYGSR